MEAEKGTAGSMPIGVNNFVVFQHGPSDGDGLSFRSPTRLPGTPTVSLPPLNARSRKHRRPCCYQRSLDAGVKRAVGVIGTSSGCPYASWPLAFHLCTQPGRKSGSDLGLLPSRGHEASCLDLEGARRGYSLLVSLTANAAQKGPLYSRKRISRALPKPCPGLARAPPRGG